MRHVKLLGTGILLLMVLVACGPSEADMQTAIAATQQAEGETATAKARDQQRQEAAASQTAAAARAAQEAASATANAENAARQTQSAATEQAAALEAQATAQAAAMYETVQELKSAGHLSKTSGTYYALSDFDQSWAQINWYQWWQTGFAPTDFVIRADVSWDTASMTANWDRSGCGFVFREDGVADHYLAFLALDGYVNFARMVNNNGTFLGRSYYGSVGKPSGSANIMLVVEGSTFTFFVNGEKVHRRSDQGLASGNLALTLLSGINTDFGTRCAMTNVGLWVLE